MQHFSLKNFSVYQGENTVFIANGDHNLFKISGGSAETVSHVLAAMESYGSVDEIFEQVKESLGNDRALFDQIMNWLLSNNIIAKSKEEQAVPRQLATHVYSGHLSDAHKTEMLQLLSDSQFTYNESSLEDAEFILVVAPIFDDFSKIESINAFAFENKIPLCHLGADSETFTMGPLADPNLRAPCLKCYSQRKMSNMDNPRETIEFVRFSDKKKILNLKIMESDYFRNVLLTYLKHELNGYFNSGGLFSQIVGRSMMFDHVNYEIKKSKIIKVQGCDICNASVLAAPLNA